MLKVAAVIPARYASTRFPGKPLTMIAGMTMIERVVAQVRKAKLVTEVLVATDNQQIMDVVNSFGGKAVLTRSDHFKGTDRVAEVILAKPEIDVVVNVQGDEPLIEPTTIDAAIKPLIGNTQVELVTVATPIKHIEELESSSVVKVVQNQQGFALYFSRAPIPFCQKTEFYANKDVLKNCKYLAHMGVYAFRRNCLLTIANLPPSPLELVESLEQLRALEHGIAIKVVEVASRSPAVDVPADVKVVESILSQGAQIRC